MQAGGDDIVIAGAGNDVIAFGASFTAADVVDGGTGSDEILLDGNYTTRVVFGTGNLASVETVAVTAGSRLYARRQFTRRRNDARRRRLDIGHRR